MEKIRFKENIKTNWWKCILMITITILFVYIGLNETLDLREIGIAYGFGFPWGMFLKRATLIGILYVFIIANIVLDTKLLWEWIYRKRWWIALALFLFFLVNKYNFSSMYMYDLWIQPGQGDEYSFPVFGEARAIRSDEYWVDLPRLLSAEYVDYGEINYILRGTEASNLEASGLQLCYAAIAEPEMWGFYLFGSEYGLSWMWSFKMIFGFLFVFEVCMIISKNNKLISLFGAVLIHFSQHNMWWSMRVAWLWCGCAAIYFFYKFIHEGKYSRRIIFGGITAIFVSNFCVSLYPAWQVPSAYIYLALVIWIMVEAKEKWKAYKAKDIILVVACTVFTVSLVGAYVYEIWDYVVGIMNTVYPGKRSISGGFAITELFRSYFSSLTPFVGDNNPCEKSCFYCVFPLGFILAIIILIKKKGKSLLLWLLTIPSLFLLWYCLMPLPEWLAKITLMSYSSPVRAIDIVGFVCCLMIVISLAELKKMGGVNLWLSMFIVIINVVIPYVYEIYMGLIGDWLKIFGVMALVTGIVQFVMIADVNTKIKNLGIIIITLFILYTGLSIHPLMSGTSVITSKPIAKEITKIVELDSKAKWITLDSRVTQNFIVACGAPTYNSIHYVPNMEMWKLLDPEDKYEDVYNRYAHVVVSLIEGETTMEVLYGDCIQLYLSYEDIEKLDISYIYSDYIIENAEAHHLELIVEQEGAYIYSVCQ